MITCKTLTTSFTPVDDAICQYVGDLAGANLLCYLLRKREYFADRGMLRVDGSYFLLSEKIEVELHLSRFNRRKAVRLLVEKGYMTTKRRGMPSKTYYRLDDKFIEFILSVKLPPLDKFKEGLEKTLQKSTGALVACKTGTGCTTLGHPVPEQSGHHVATKETIVKETNSKETLSNETELKNNYKDSHKNSKPPEEQAVGKVDLYTFKRNKETLFVLQKHLVDHPSDQGTQELIEKFASYVERDAALLEST